MKNYIKKMPLFLSIIFFVFSSIVFISLYKKINDNDQKAKQDTTTWQKEARRRDDLMSLNRSSQEIADDQVLLGAHFAKSSDIVPFLDTIEKLAPKVGASAEINSVDALANNTGLVVGLKASGSFQAVYKFLTLLENSPYELDFLSMDMHGLTANVSNEKVKDSQWEAVFRIQLLSFVP